MRRFEVAVLFSFMGCSLMGLDELEPIPCNDDSDCEAASRAFPDPDGCGSYVCSAHLCVLPSNQETCNDEDDDCNGWINDGIARVSGERSGEPPALPTAFAAASDGSATYVAIGGELSEGWIITDEGAVRLENTLQYKSAAGYDQYPCPTAKSQADCDFSQIAVAADGRNLVYVAINRKGCTRGQLRIGLSSKDDNPFSIWLGKSVGAAAESNIAFGVDIDERNCTGASVGQSGASHPAVAVMDTTAGKAGALVSWLFAPIESESEASEENCSRSESIDVGALGVFVPAGEYGWLDGANDGKPVILGQTQSRSAPAVLAIRTTDAPAYLVGFATTVEEGRGIGVTAVQLVGKHLDLEALLLLPDPDPRRVVFALGPEGNGSVDIGVAWTSGCAADRVVRFATIRYTTQGPLSADVTLIAGPRTIEAPDFAGGLSVLFEPQGFATAAPSGGWSLLWLEASPEKGRDVRLARFAESELEPLNETTLVSGAIGFPIVYAGKESALNYALIRPRRRGPSTSRNNWRVVRCQALKWANLVRRVTGLSCTRWPGHRRPPGLFRLRRCC